MAKSVDDLANGVSASDGAQDTADLVRREEQVFGDNPLEVRESDHYTHEYVGGFVDKWDDLIDWKKRAESEGKFFVEQLKKRGVKSVLDAAAGTGFHSVRLLEEGFETVTADGSPQMLAQAFQNGLEYGGYVLRVVHADWRWLNRDVHGEYDAIIVLGNSFTHLFSERDRRKALAEFYAMLKHDGVLILDQRNYDSILDNGFSSKHTYYYAGEDVSAEPDYVDEGLARFKYTFPDKSQFFLNMYPLRKNYMRRLMREVGFQHIETYGDFQQTYGDEEPDFFIHVAEKSYRTEEELQDQYSTAVHTARDYYNSDDADNFYFHVWGGNDIHVGLYNGQPDDSIDAASRRTVERMAGKVQITPETRVLDIGAGYGGAARYLARTYGCKVSCLNLSEVENRRNEEFNRAEGLDHLIEVKDGSFEDIPYQDNAFDLVWSQDAILHSGDRERVLEEVTRVLGSKGDFVFTDPMASDNANKKDLGPILARLHLDSLGSPGFYRRKLAALGLQSFDFDDLSEYLPLHYGKVLEVLESRESELADKIGEQYRTNMKEGLRNWVAGGNGGNLAWGIVHAKA